VGNCFASLVILSGERGGGLDCWVGDWTVGLGIGDWGLSDLGFWVLWFFGGVGWLVGWERMGGWLSSTCAGGEEVL